MPLDTVFNRFVEQSPVTVMVGGMLERVLSPEKLDDLFEETADTQYTRELLFSAVFDKLSRSFLKARQLARTSSSAMACAILKGPPCRS